VVELLDRRLIFVTGKGGVGKTTIAAALGLLAASKGKRTLLCEMDAKGDLASNFETEPTKFQEREIAPNLWAMSMDTEASLHQYLSLQLRFGRAAYVGPLAKMFDFVASAAPGVREIVNVGKLCWEVRERRYDIVVVDAVASGHIIGQLAAPQAINRLVQVGLIRQQTGWMLEILSDPKTSGVLAVTTPEEMPVSETIELIGRLEAETTVGLAGVVVNRVLPELFGTREEQVFEAISAAPVTGELSALLGGPAEPLLEAARLMVRMRRSRVAYVQRLREALGQRLSPASSSTGRSSTGHSSTGRSSTGRSSAVAQGLYFVPFLFLRSYGLRSTRQVASALAAELET
jgi:anion-transporting  ArsA/GET3 family ATPase